MDVDDETASTTPAAALPAMAPAAAAKMASNPNTSINSDDPDPIVASYDVFTNAVPPPHRRFLILQHPNQKQPGPDHYRQVSEVRLKPKSGMFEVDVPLSHQRSDYDREKGQSWGTTLQRSAAAKNGGSQGLAGGFGVGVQPARGGGGGKRRTNPDGDEVDMDMGLSWNEAVRQDKVLRTQTLGGQFPLDAESNCQWMIGIFQGNQLHLTPASHLIQLRPQLHHVDAAAEQDRLARPREPGTATGTAAAQTGPGGKENTAASAGRAITMSIKSAGGNEPTTETMTDRLRGVQTESWSKLKYEDEDSQRAWDLFEQGLVYNPAAQQPAKEKESKIKTKESGDGDKGKGKELAGATGEETSAHPQLHTTWAEKDFLKAVSGMSGTEGQDGTDENNNDDNGDGGDHPVEIKRENVGASTTARPVASAVAKGKGKASTAGGGAAAGKGKSVSFKGAGGGSTSGNAMEID